MQPFAVRLARVMSTIIFSLVVIAMALVVGSLVVRLAVFMSDM